MEHKTIKITLVPIGDGRWNLTREIQTEVLDRIALTGVKTETTTTRCSSLANALEELNWLHSAGYLTEGEGS